VIEDALSRLESTGTGDRDARRGRHPGGPPTGENGAAPAGGATHHRPQPRPTLGARPRSAREEPGDLSPDDAYVYRFLAQACVAAGAYSKALEFVTAGLARIPRDAGLIATRGDARSGLHDDEGASADWQLAHDLREGEGSDVRGPSRSG
jgi:hypothetical protein